MNGLPVPAKDSMADSGNPSYQWSRYFNKAASRLPVWKWNPNSGFCATWQYSRETSLRRVSMNTAGGLESGECT
jgi:hypothetical protein